MAILNNGKLIDRRYHRDKVQKKEETGILKTGGDLIVTVVAALGLLALAAVALMDDQDWY